MSKRTQLHLNLNIYGAGGHAAAWLWPENDPLWPVTPDYFVKLAQTAERGAFDAIFFSDRAAFPGNSLHRPFPAIEPTILLTLIAAHTQHIGLLATVSSSYNEPYNIARRFASLDLVSGGRSGVNIVTSADVEAARNFGLTAPMAHGERYQRAAEFSQVLKDLWASWGPAGITADRSTGQYFDPAHIQPIAHQGKFFSVQGPLNVPPSPQGRPLIVQAGGSDAGLDLAAQHADAVFTLAASLEQAQHYRQALDVRLNALGRATDAVKVFPGLVTVLGDTEHAAQQRAQALADLVPIEQGLNYLSDLLHTRFRHADLDNPLPADLRLPDNGMTTFAKNVIDKARAHHWTVRELIRAQNGGGSNHNTIVGTPEQVAEYMLTWFRSGAIDGFNVMHDVLPSGLEDFVDHVVPILRRAGVYRETYTAGTLRGNLGLPVPHHVQHA